MTIDWFYQMKTIRRLWFFYSVFFIFPLGIWTVFYFFQFRNYIADKFYRYYEGVVSDMVASYDERIMRITNMVEILEQNSNFVDYLEDWNMSTAERVYAFNRDIQPLMSYVISVNALFEDIKIFSYRSDRIPPYYFINQWDEHLLPMEAVLNLGLHQALWQYDGTERLRCYIPIYGTGYTSQAGCVVFSINVGELLGVFRTEGIELPVIMEYGGTEHPLFTENKDTRRLSLVHKLELHELNARLRFYADLRQFPGWNISAILVPVFLLFVLITSIIFINFAAGTRRITALAKHLATTDYSSPVPLDRGRYRDEIGFLFDAYNQMAANINHLVNNVYRAEIKSRDEHYYALQAQLNPHFLLNSLENIRMITLMRGDHETSAMIFKLARIMDYTIHQSGLISTLAREVEHCRNYLEFCMMRIGKTFSFSINCPQEFSEWPCPKFILQPIVENAIEHAFDAVTMDKNVSISVSSVAGGALVRVRDNGCGMGRKDIEALHLRLDADGAGGNCGENDPQSRGHGVGILNVHERLKIFYGNGYGITVESEIGKGSEFILCLGNKPGIFESIGQF
ncbi:MAG: histidine kinase [Spirochaetaceae bacterium]|jgi:two-component system sensor histidine kinase YesM|nr:histidine kinase [Spirochaetaceae bacterium]